MFIWFFCNLIFTVPGQMTEPFDDWKNQGLIISISYIISYINIILISYQRWLIFFYIIFGKVCIYVAPGQRRVPIY